MARNITSESISFYKDLLAKYEPYPLEILDDLMFDDTRYDQNRIDATFAKKRLLECGIPLTDDEPAQK